MGSLALVVLAAFPFIGALALAFVGQRSFARRYHRARQKTAAMTEAADAQHERTAATVARLGQPKTR